MIDECRKFLLDGAKDWGLPAGGEWTFLLHNNYHPHCSNMNLLWFRNGEHFPRVVTKIFHEPELPGREFRNQSWAWSRVPDSVPKPPHYGMHGGRFWALWMEGAPGFPLQPDQANAQTAMPPIVDTVAAMHVAMRTTGSEDRYRRMVLDPVQTLLSFGNDKSVQAGCQVLVKQCPPRWLQSLPAIPQHGDLFFSNLLRHGNHWSILDWESFGKIDLPAYDLFTLLFSWLRAGGETPSEWNPVLAGQMPPLVARYANRVGLPLADLPRLLTLTLVNWFHLQWTDGRAEFTRLMYRSLAHYFENRNSWERTFIPAS